MRFFLASLCLVLAACGPQDAEVIGDDEPTLEGPEETLGEGILLDLDYPVVTYAEVEEGFLIDGDIVIERDGVHLMREGDDLATTRSALMSTPKHRRWPNARIPFQFDENTSPAMRELVRDAMAWWENNTPVRFVPHNGETDFLHIRAWSGSYSYANIGHQGGKQYATIQRNCVGTSWGRGLIAHELGHTMGLWHEQMRVDRNEHVVIHWDNIKDGKKSNFRKYDNGLLLTTYNIGSIMHYGSKAFSRNGKPTITRKDGSTFRQNFGKPTERDFAGVTKFYSN